MSNTSFNPSSNYMWNNWKNMFPVQQTLTYGIPLVSSTNRNLGKISDTMTSVLSSNTGSSFGTGLPKTAYTSTAAKTAGNLGNTTIPSASYSSTTPTPTTTGNAINTNVLKQFQADLASPYSSLSSEIFATNMNAPKNYTFLDSGGNSFVAGSATNPFTDFYNAWNNDTTLGLSNGTWQGVGTVANLANMAYQGVMQYLNYRQAKKAAEEQKALNHANYAATAKAYNSKFKSGNYIGRAMVGAGYTDEMRQKDDAGLKEAMVAENY